MKWQSIVKWLLIGAVFVTQLLVIVPSGSKYCLDNSCGIYFWGAHEHDSVWHLAVSQTLFNNRPFEMPNMAGTAIRGYNYLLDLSIASLSYITSIPDSTWFFKLFPIIWLTVMLKLLYRFAKIYRPNSTFPNYLMFFVFFGSSFSYLLNLYQRGSVWGASSLLSMQAIQNMLNPQFGYSLILVLIMLIMMGENKKSTRDYVIYGILAATAIGLKFYTGVVMMIMLAVDLLLDWLQKSNTFWQSLVKGSIILGFVGVSVLLFYSPATSTGSPLIFSPLTTVNPIIEDKSLFYLPVWAERLYSYTGVKLFVVEMMVLGIYIIMNFGSRVFALIGSTKADKLSNLKLKKIIWIGASAGLLLAILFIQKGVWWNTVQFLYVSLFLFGILAAEGLDSLHQKKTIFAKLAIALIIILTIPTNLDVIKTFAKFPGSSYISEAELEALATLEKQEQGVVFTGSYKSRDNLSYDTAYVQAFSGKQVYLNDLIQLELTNIDYSERLQLSQGYDCSVLEQVEYVYEHQDNLYADRFGNCGRKLEKFFENDMINLYRVR